VTASAAAAEIAIRRGGPETAGGGRFRPAAGHELLLQIVGDRGDEARAALEAWCGTFDPRLPVDGGTYRLLPMIFHRMREWNVDHELRPLLKGVYRRSLVANSRLVDGAAPALQALTDQGLAPVLLKGAALVADGYYPTLATRPMADIDVYVTREDHGAAVAVLEGFGWRSPLPAARHAVTFESPGGVATIDLHLHAIGAVMTQSSDLTLTAGIRQASGLDLAASVPDPTAQLLITLIHGADPNPEPTVRWVADALLVLTARDGITVDWNRVVDYARAQQVGLLLVRMLEVLGAFAGGDVPPPVIESLRSLPTWPLERWERRMMDSDHSSLAKRITQSTVRASADQRSASTPALLIGLLRRYHDTWQVPWTLVPVVAISKFLQHVTDRRV